MKTKHIYFAAVCLVTVGPFSRAFAQPPAAGNAIANPPEAQAWREPEYVAPGVVRLHEAELGKRYTGLAPRQIVESFLWGLQRKAGRESAFLVSGSNWESLDNEKLMKVIEDVPSRISRFGLAGPVGQEQDPAGHQQALENEGKEATVDVMVNAIDDLGIRLGALEKVRLRREQTAGGPVWRIVAPDTDPLSYPQKKQLGVIQTYAFYFQDANRSIGLLRSRESMNQVKQLLLGILQFTQDYDEKFDFTEKNWWGKISPYVKASELFTAPGDDEYTVSYALNPKLAGKKLSDVAAPASTVAVYLGKDGKPDFRFGGLSVVGYADGHVKRVSEEEAKTLRWDP